ncbi:hypothetical protein MHB42_06700 [Lysinibacillus sp. FSL K6-0232]|uniref:hypothetical protein n=1 Tax=unclassified Lysinibacillus TaxID=2636778 RepID=UPI0030F8BD9F
MNILKDEHTYNLKVDSRAMALAYKEMGELNLHISMEMDYLEWEAQKILESFLEKIKVLDI